MEFFSTRNRQATASAAQAIMQGISKDGGLFVPAEFPQVALSEILNKTYTEIAVKVIGSFLTDYTTEFLKQSVEESYSVERFCGKTAEVKKIKDGLFSMELWHGPTCAFKDYALQLMPKLLVEAKKINKETDETVILVATSGDTGKAALDGYHDIEGIKIAVFYPNAGTSEVQRLQMVTQEGANVAVFAVNGNFDHAQTGVKKAFTDVALAERLAQKGIKLSSANSINWGRLVPQIVYYFASYAKLVEQGAVQLGDKIDFCVPTGNFGDILAGFYAKKMGLPVGKLICASNTNNVLADFLSTGTYAISDRAFHKTTSPSMDILISSNLERLLYHMCEDTAYVAELMAELAANGSYTVKPDILAKIKEHFACGFATDEQVAAEIKKVLDEDAYLCDTHTAVAFKVYEDYAAEQKDNTPCVVVSTASPFKFPRDVIAALGQEAPQDDFAAIEALEKVSGYQAPKALSTLKQKTVRFTQVLNPDEIATIAEKL